MRAVALLGGPKTEWPTDLVLKLKQAKLNHDLIIGVDRGSLLLIEMGINPDLALGDFDSLKVDELAKIERTVKDIRYSNPIKDLTDSELMIRTAFLDYQVTGLTIYGASGGRLDHSLVNLFMFLSPVVRHFSEKVKIVDQQNIVVYCLPGHRKILRQAGYPYFGVFCLGQISHLSIKHAKYPLMDFSTAYPKVFSSNEFLAGEDYFMLSFKAGIVAVIFSKDLDRYQNLDIK